jgi:hypothetical protein
MGKQTKMTDTKKISLCLAVIAVLGLVVYKAAQKSAAPKQTQEQGPDQEVLDQVDTEATTQASPQAGALKPLATFPPLAKESATMLQAPLSEKEIKSVRQLSRLLVRTISKNANVQTLTNEIKALGLTPVRSVDENKYTGRMTILRTEDALEGTRFLHIQVLGNGPGNEGTQMISFQVRPGADSFAKTVALVEKSLPKGSQVKEKSSDYQSWALPNCYIARVHTMNMEDLAANKYNAFSKEDVGSINAVLEQDIHCGADADEH